MSKIFLSHAGADHEIALRVAGALREAGLEPVLDREKLSAGNSFVAFMEDALATSDYCLLLWSAVAATRQWVQEEWQAALRRSVDEARAFLVVGRLDAHKLPALLAPRLYVELHPQVTTGLNELVGLWRNDRSAEEDSGRPVASVPGLAAEAAETIYVSSELFGITVPWAVDLDAPASLAVDQLRKSLGLPVQIDHDNRVGVRFEYHLAFGEVRLRRSKSLRAQGVRNRDVLWLQSVTQVFSAIAPEEGEFGKAVFRGDVQDMDGLQTIVERPVSAEQGTAALSAAHQYLNVCVERARLGR